MAPVTLAKMAAMEVEADFGLKQCSKREEEEEDLEEEGVEGVRVDGMTMKFERRGMNKSCPTKK